jgi:hypothetical protein
MRRELTLFNGSQPLGSLGLQIGIETGPVISGDTSGPLNREFHVLGDAVNTAARLKAKASSGEIWVGEETWRTTGEFFDYAPKGALELKGKQRKVRAFAAQEAKERAVEAKDDSQRPVASEPIAIDGAQMPAGPLAGDPERDGHRRSIDGHECETCAYWERGDEDVRADGVEG